MIKEAIEKILSLSVPNQVTVGDKLYVDKTLLLVTPPRPSHVPCSTLQGLVDLLKGNLEDVDKATGGDLLIHIESPTKVSLISRKSDNYGRRQVYAEAEYPKGCTTFTFGAWLNPENFIIMAQQSFQRVKIQNDDGSFAQDLDYVLKIASGISAESVASNDDDGLAQRVAVKQGVVLKTETALRPLVNLAPYRTFAEIDQVLSQFVFRARIQGEQVHLALFEGDGGRWRLGAVAAIKTWLSAQITGIPIIS
jgi:hypothetical protein